MLLILEDYIDKTNNTHTKAIKKTNRPSISFGRLNRKITSNAISIQNYQENNESILDMTRSECICDTPFIIRARRG